MAGPTGVITAPRIEVRNRETDMFFHSREGHVMKSLLVMRGRTDWYWFAVPGAMIIVFWAMLLVPAGAAAAGGQATAEWEAATPVGPNWQYAVHQNGRIVLTVTNLGQLGPILSGIPTDCGGQPCPGCEYPAGSELQYLFGGAFWIGAVVGTDTLASVGADGWFQVAEMNPDSGTSADFQIRSNDPASPYYSPQAVANLDYICTYADTCTDPALVNFDPIDNRPHIPLNVSVTQRSYSWADDPNADFVLFEYVIANIGAAPLQDMYFGILVDGDVYHSSNSTTGYADDMTGFLPADNMAYIIDNDGDPVAGPAWDNTSPRSAFAVKLHGSKPDWGGVNYNWWISNANTSLDFGPRLAGTVEDPFRSFGPHLGTPSGDKNKYYMLQHPEQDYDQMFTAVSHAGEGFLAPPSNPSFAADLADGIDTRFLLSVGPYQVGVGDSVRLYFSVVMGPDAHVNPGDFADYFTAGDPDAYYQRLDFDPLLANAGRADYLYQNIFGTPSGVEDDVTPSALPQAATLSPNYPNPFNPATTIRYQLPKRSQVQMTVFNLLGETVTTLVDDMQDAGEHVTVWDGCDRFGHPAPSGIYFYRLKTDGVSTAKKMVLMR